MSKSSMRSTGPLLALGLAAGTALVGAGCSGGSGSSGSARFGQGALIAAEATPEVSALERAMHARLNRDRKKKGLPALAFDAELSAIGRAHSEDMRQNRFFSHDSRLTGSLEDRLDRAGYTQRAARENLGEGPDVDGTQDALLESPGHYANIMATDVTHVGIGIVKGGVAVGTNLLVTQVFASRVAPGDATQARQVVSQRIDAARRAAGLSPLSRHPKLEELAQQHVGQLSDDLSAASTGRIGDVVVKQLSGSGLRGAVVGGSVFITAEMYEPRGAVMQRDARAVGLATAPAKDERGRPAVKLLLLVGM